MIKQKKGVFIMFCKQCGKEISNEAFMCPDCGAPTDNAPMKREMPPAEDPKPVTCDQKNHMIALSTIAFALSIFAFITGIVDVFCIPIILSNILISLSILPAFTGFSIGLYSLIYSRNQKNGIAKPFSIVAIVFTSVTLLFLFILTTIYGANYYYIYN